MYHKWQSYEVWFLRYGPWRAECFVILDHFSHSPLPPLINQKIKILKKWKNHLEILSLYTSVPQMTITWCMVLEIWSVTDKMFCYFGPFFALFTLLTNLKNQNFEKVKKSPWNNIILYKCTKNHDHLVYCSLDMACNRCNCYFSFWAIFCPFTSLTAQKTKFKKKMKKNTWRYHYFTLVYQKLWSYAILLLSFRFLTWKIKILKKWKRKPGDIITFYTLKKNFMAPFYGWG